MLLLGALVASAGAVWLPLDGHEALVVQTAREMRDRGEWVVPWYNGEHRLAKPPLSYWLVRIVATAAGSPERIEPWHGRLPAILCGLGGVALTLLLGTRLFDRGTGLTAAALSVASVGFFGATHDARSDTLYAFLCGLGIACFTGAWAARERRGRAAAFSFAMWASFGAATLAKGPHVPAMFLAAMAIFCALRGSGWRETLALLRPLSGAALAALVAAPWWIALLAKVGRPELHGSQLEGTLLGVDWRQALGLFYVYRPLLFALPWALLLPWALRLLWRRELRSDAVLLLALLYAVPLLALGFGAQQRVIYARPMEMPLLLLLAAGIVQPLRAAGSGAPLRTWRVFVASCLGAAIPLSAWMAGSAGATPVGRVAAAAALGAASLGLALLWRSRAAPSRAWGELATVVGVTALVLVAGGGTRVFFAPSRFAKPRLAEEARAAAGERTPIVTLGLMNTPYVYYSGRSIEMLASAEELVERREGSPTGELVVLAATALVPTLPPGLAVEVLDSFPDAPDDAGSLLRVSAAPAPAGPGP